MALAGVLILLRILLSMQAISESLRRELTRSKFPNFSTLTTGSIR